MVGTPALVCTKMATAAAAAQCQANVPPVPQTSAPNFDALAIAISGQNNAIASQASYLTLGSIIFALVAIVAGVGWGYLVKGWAEKAAKDSVREWMDENAPGEIARVLSAITPPNLDGGSAPMTQEEQEVGLGGEAA